MQTIEKIIKSTIPPQQTNVLWLDISGEVPVLKSYKGGEWLPVSDETGLVQQLAIQIGIILGHTKSFDKSFDVSFY